MRGGRFADAVLRAIEALPDPTTLQTMIVSGISKWMVSRTQLTIVLAGAVFLAACAYVGYVNEFLKDVVSPIHRFVLLTGFILGAGCVSRWIMAQDLKRNLKRIKRARSNRTNGS